MSDNNVLISNTSSQNNTLSNETITLNHNRKARLNRLKKRFCLQMYVITKKKVEDLGTSCSYPRKLGERLPKGKEVVIKDIDWEKEVLLVETKDGKKMVDVLMSDVRISINQALLMRYPNMYSKFILKQRSIPEEAKVKIEAFNKEQEKKDKQERRKKETEAKKLRMRKLAVISIFEGRIVKVMIFDPKKPVEVTKREFSEEYKTKRRREVDSIVKKLQQKYSNKKYRTKVVECSVEGPYYLVKKDYKGLLKGDFVRYKKVNKYDKGFVSAHEKTFSKLFLLPEILSNPDVFKSVAADKKEFKKFVQKRNRQRNKIIN